MMCVYGGAGFGKTLAVNTCLRELEPDQAVRRIAFRPAPPPARGTPRDLRRARPGRHPTRAPFRVRPSPQRRLATRPRTLIVDEAQWLSSEAFEYFRYLWDDYATSWPSSSSAPGLPHRATQGTDACLAHLHLAEVLPPHPKEVLQVIPTFHPYGERQGGRHPLRRCAPPRTETSATGPG
ncbi:ATP-binding protein [Streptomyces sp. T1317-0309]|nr:ATP-binding protein [Streptomyces sp. T1317-0309]